MTGWLALAPLPIAVVLVVSGRLKVTSRTARTLAAKSAFGTLVGTDRAPRLYGALGVVELAVAAALLVGGVPVVPVRQVAAAAAVVLTAGFAGYLTYARVFAPDSSCGCVSARQAPVTWRSFARAGLLLALSAVALVSGGAWSDALRARPVAGVAVVAAVLVGVVLLSPEADRSWLMPLRKLRAQLRPHPLAGDAFDLPLANTLQQLQRSSAYRNVGATLSSDVLDSWDEGDWRIVCYRTGDAETVVFAVPRLRYEPEAVKVALVPEPVA